MILSLAGDHDRRWKWHRSVPKLLARAEETSRGCSHLNQGPQPLQLDYSHLDPPSAIILHLQSEAQAGISVGPMILIFGCRRESMDLLRRETDKLGFAIFSFLMQRIFVFLMFM